MLRTRSYQILRERLEDAVDEGINAIVYGPPSSEKSYVLENLCTQFRAKGRPVIYMYCGPRTTLTQLYRGVAEAAGIEVRSSFRWACRRAVLDAMRTRPHLPAIVLDEAQHLDVDALEGVREIHDMTRREERRGCGVILAGSHNLLREFLHPARRPRLEQMLSRFAHRVQLEGMSKPEILTLASRAFGNGKPAKLSEEQQKILLDRCTVDDPYFIDANGKPTSRTYYSSRRLLEYIRQQKKLASVAESAA
ncbi:MAG TPA: ATP-binding protein [Candidatus Acidoferrum sp.]|nr:ATP-binding protein [Candidatus Acidoferrum sp.]